MPTDVPTVSIHTSRRVVCRAVIPLPLPASAAWGQLRDFRSSACHDPFHCDIEIDGVPRTGAAIVLGHRYILFHTTRVGRILKWTEGVGFAFSDLCATDPRRAFPHVLSYRLEPADDGGSRLHLLVTGRWTSPLPRWAGRLWLWWVFRHVVRSVENQLLAYAVVYRDRKRSQAGA